MVRQWFGSIAALLAGAGLALGQPVPPVPPPPSTPPQPVQTAQPANAVQPSDTTKPTTPVSPVLPAVPNPLVPVVPPFDPNSSNDCVFLTKPYTDHSRVWFQAEYLLWWIRSGGLPSVVGTAPASQVATGSISSASIEPLFGGSDDSLDYHEQSGLRLSTGFWLDNTQCWGVDGSFFQLEQKNIGSTFASSGDPVIGPVFFDPKTNTTNLIPVSLPNFMTGPLAGQPRMGGVAVGADNHLWSADINVRKQIGAVFFADHLDFLMGFRHLQFSEGVDVVTDSTSAAGSFAPTTLHIEDHLGVLNQFYGPQIGLASHTQKGRWSFDAIGKLALGDMHEVSNINGSTLLTTPTTTIASNTGVLAEPTNIGRPTRDRFAVVPELTLNVGYQVIENVRVTLGYNFLYLNTVARAGDLVDGVNITQVRSLSSFNATTPATHPEFQQPDSRFWAQGVNVGIEVRY